MIKSAIITVRVPRKTRQAVSKIAKNEERTISQVAYMLIEESLRRRAASQKEGQ